MKSPVHPLTQRHLENKLSQLLNGKRKLLQEKQHRLEFLNVQC